MQAVVKPGELSGVPASCTCAGGAWLAFCNHRRATSGQPAKGELACPRPGAASPASMQIRKESKEGRRTPGRKLTPCIHTRPAILPRRRLCGWAAGPRCRLPCPVWRRPAGHQAQRQERAVEPEPRQPAGRAAHPGEGEHQWLGVWAQDGDHLARCAERPWMFCSLCLPPDVRYSTDQPDANYSAVCCVTLSTAARCHPLCPINCAGGRHPAAEREPGLLDQQGRTGQLQVRERDTAARRPSTGDSAEAVGHEGSAARLPMWLLPAARNPLACFCPTMHIPLPAATWARRVWSSLPTSSCCPCKSPAAAARSCWRVSSPICFFIPTSQLAVHTDPERDSWDALA